MAPSSLINKKANIVGARSGNEKNGEPHEQPQIHNAKCNITIKYHGKKITSLAAPSNKGFTSNRS